MAGPSTSNAGIGGRRRPLNLADDDIAELAAIRDLLQDQSFGERQLVFREGDPGDRVYVIRSGLVKVTRCGRANLVALAGPGDIVGELSVFDPGPRTSSVVAIGPSVAGWLDRATLRRWMVDRPSTGLALLQLLARQVKRRHDQFAEQRIQDLEVRVQLQLEDMASRFGVEEGDGSTSLPPLSTSELADLVGGESTHVSEIVHRLVRATILGVDGPRLATLDRRALQQVMTSTE